MSLRTLKRIDAFKTLHFKNFAEENIQYNLFLHSSLFIILNNKKTKSTHHLYTTVLIKTHTPRFH